MALLELKNIHVALEDGTEIVKGVDLAVDTNQIHAIMGPNGSGKSTLAYALMGHPAYEITEGQIFFDGEDVTELEADERAQRGLFLAFQYPHAIPGVTVTSFLRSAINAIRKARNDGEDDPVKIPEFRKDLLAAMEKLKVPRELAQRYLNDGFSGGEKKRMEILQLALQQPKLAVLDETDSGLDVDALKVVSAGVNAVRNSFTGIGSSTPPFRPLRIALIAVRRKFVTVTPGIACGYWKARKMPRWARSSAAASVTSSPSTRIWPSVIS
ncbi:MAG: Fe-S cluster assembly ATPase SufC [Gaiellaceae bacterium]